MTFTKVRKNETPSKYFYYFCTNLQELRRQRPLRETQPTYEMTTLYLARHGETVDNANQIMQGQTQGRLTEKGREQARQLADAMTGVHIDAFVSSDLKRAVDTCATVAEARGGNVVTTPLLRERDWGSFTGRYIPDLKDAVWTDDIESIDALKERARKFLDYIKANFPSQAVFAVGHGIINKAIQSVYYNKEMKDIPPMQNAEVRKLEI